LVPQIILSFYSGPTFKKEEEMMEQKRDGRDVRPK